MCEHLAEDTSLCLLEYYSVIQSGEMKIWHMFQMTHNLVTLYFYILWVNSRGKNKNETQKRVMMSMT